MPVPPSAPPPPPPPAPPIPAGGIPIQPYQPAATGLDDSQAKPLSSLAAALQSTTLKKTPKVPLYFICLPSCSNRVDLQQAICS